MKRNVFLLAIVALASNAVADDDLRKQFFKEAPKAWKVFQDQHRPAQVVFSWHTIDPKTGEEKVISTTEIRTTKDAILVLEQNHEDETVTAKVGRYGFKAKTPVGQVAWKGNIIRPVTKPFEDYMDRWGYRWLDLPIAPGGVRMPDLIDREGVTIKSIEFVKDEAKEKKVRFTFSCKEGYQDLPGAEMPIQSGVVTVTPSRFWTIDKAVLQTSEGEITTTFRYGKRDQGKLVVLSHELRIKHPKRDEVVVTRKYDEYSHTPLDASAFSPASYGLPVPNEDD